MLVERSFSVFGKLFKVKAELEKAGLSKDADGYGFKYLSLQKLLSVLDPILMKNGIYLTQTATVENDMVVIDTIFVDVEAINGNNYLHYQNRIPILKEGKMNTVQSYGASVSYGRRYALLEILGLAPDETEDADAPEYATEERKREIEEKKKAIEALGLSVDKDGKIMGKTFEFKNQLKQLGCRWDSQAKAWVVA